MAPRVMVVGFETTSTKTLVDGLQAHSYAVIAASADQTTLVQAVTAANPAVILFDLPPEHYHAAAEVIYKLTRVHPIPVILLTNESYSGPMPIPASFMHIFKPVTPDSLARIVDLVAARGDDNSLRARLSLFDEAEFVENVGHWEQDLVTNELRVSKECLRLHGLPPSTSVSLEALLANVHHDDRDRINRMLEKAREECACYKTEYQVAKRHSPVRVIGQQCIVHCDPQGRPSRLLSAVRDITEQVRTEHELRESEKRASQLLRERDFILENTRDVLYYIDDKWNIYYITPSVEQITGFTVDEWHSPFVAHLADTPNNRRAIGETLEILRTGRTYPPSDIDIVHKNGGIIVAEVNEKPIISNGRVVGIVGVARDVTEKRQGEHRLLQATAVFDNMLEAVIIADAHRRITAVNRSFVDITGYEETEAFGRDPDFLSAGAEDDVARARAWEEVSQGGRWAGELWNRRKSGEAFPSWTAISTISDKAGKVANYVVLSTDLSRLRESEEKLDRLAHYDPLTHLPNRLLFNSRLSHSIRMAERHGKEIAVLFVDLDHFKSVNDTLGHPAGDRLLQEVALRLVERLRKEDTVAHLGGDEFVVILEDFSDLRYIAGVAKKLLDCLARTYQLNGTEAVITASMGISIYPRDGTDVTRLVQNADTAMYRAKELGRAKFQFYTADLTANAIERMALITALRTALEKNEFLLHYQPQLSLENGEIIGVEALVRWRHPERGLTQPTAFIPIEEETGQIAALGEWVLYTACAQAREWETAGAGKVRIAVNISALQLTHEMDLVKRVGRILRETGLHPNQLELEITESAIMRSAKEAVTLIGELKALGVRLAIDDFGTGYSSMSYLKTFAVDRLKVDSSFIHDLPANTNVTAIVRAIIALGHTLQMKVLAEGVETPDQQTFLRDNGCDEIQGYLFSPPLPEQQCREMLLSTKR